MADAAASPTKPANKKAFVLLIALLVVCLVGSGAYLYLTRPKASQQQTEAALDNLSADDQAAIAELQTAYQDAASAEGKAKAAYYLAARYTSAEDHNRALSYYQEAEKFYKGDNIDVVLGIANEADALEKKSLAAEYYKKAIDYYKPLVETQPSLQAVLDRFQARVMELK
jgi:tetratricopeptide (TPR) repeat protein